MSLTTPSEAHMELFSTCCNVALQSCDVVLRSASYLTLSVEGMSKISMVDNDVSKKPPAPKAPAAKTSTPVKKPTTGGTPASSAAKKPAPAATKAPSTAGSTVGSTTGAKTPVAAKKKPAPAAVKPQSTANKAPAAAQTPAKKPALTASAATGQVKKPAPAPVKPQTKTATPAKPASTPQKADGQPTSATQKPTG